MRKGLLFLVSVFIIGLLAACGDDNNDTNETDELLMLEVEFEVPETLDVDETLELMAEVTYGDEPELEAEVNFEVWETGDQDNSVMLEGTNNGDGTYSAEYTFEHDGIFEMYAHTDAQNLHTMPKREIIVGEGGHYEEEQDEDHDGHSHEFHTEGFDMHFMEPESLAVTEEAELMTHITMNEEALENAKVRYEIWQEDDVENTAWVDATEENAGEYIGTHVFEEAGTYNIQIHVEDDEDLHEHVEYELEVQ